MSRVGSVYTRVTAGQTDVLIESGQTVSVLNIVCTNTHATNDEVVTIEEANSSTVIQTIGVKAGASFNLNFSADGQLFHRGLQITTPATTVATVYHTHGGA